MKSLLILMITLALLQVNLALAAASSDIGVALVERQFSAQLIAEADFKVQEPNGKETAVPKGKYFIAANGTRLQMGERSFMDGSTFVSTDEKKYFSVNKQRYRGSLLIELEQQGTSLSVINKVHLEDYVNSVLGPNSSPIWPDEAIKAQAIAVRSLAYYHRYQQRGSYAVLASDSASYYGGVDNEKKAVSRVAATTAGQVLFYEGAPAETYFGESSGGTTVAATEALGRAVPYLVEVEDYDRDCPSFKWEKRLTVANIGRILNQNGYKIGTPQSFRLTIRKEPYGRDRTASGRVQSIYWKGTEGSAAIPGPKFMEMLGLSSTLFDILPDTAIPEKLDVAIENGYGIEVGRKEIPITINGVEEPKWKQVIPGYYFLTGAKDEALLLRGNGIGPGMGLSKWGAKGMADQAPAGAKDYYKTILQHYYPGTYLVSLD